MTLTPTRRADPTARILELADEFVTQYFAHHPEAATTEGYPPADHGRLADNSPAGVAAWQALEDGWLRAVRDISADSVRGTDAALPYSYLLETLEASVGLRTCRYELWGVSPTFSGWQAWLAFVARVQPVGTETLRAQTLARFGSIPAFLDTEIANLREGVRLGFTAPRNNVKSVIEQLGALIEAPVRQSPFFDPALRDETPAFVDALARLIVDRITPAVVRYRDYVAEEYLPVAREAIGISANPSGADGYRASVRSQTSVEVPAEEIYRLGLAEMDALQAEMAIIAKRSFGTSDVREALHQLKTDPRYMFASREALTACAQDAVDRAKAACPEWFGLVPEADVVIQPYPAFQEKTAPGGQYNPPSEDGTRPGIYLINTYHPEEQSRAGVETTAFHETYPGHHLQIAIARERQGVHPITRYFGSAGFAEGWALYSERLSHEMGLFTSDVDLMGMLAAQSHRAARLVVDPGMHVLGWSRERAVEYLGDHTTLPPAQVESEIDRYIAVPGQATAYMIGYVEVRRLRAEAEKAMGARFDIRAFHDRVLENGTVMLPFLQDHLTRWIHAAGAQDRRESSGHA